MEIEHQFTHLLRSDRSLALMEMAKAAIRPGDRVLDAGTGTGVLAMLAARLGASRVWAVDIDDVSLARETARDNGLEQVEFQQADLSKLPAGSERFDVIFGLLYLNDARRDEARSALKYDLRERFLAPGGRLLPNRVRYCVQPLAWPARNISRLRGEVDQGLTQAEQDFGLNFSTLRRRLPETAVRRFFPPRDLDDGRVIQTGADPLATEQLAFEIDYRADSPPGYPEAFELEISHAGVCDVLLWAQELWFDRLLVYRNETVTWVEHPSSLAAGERVRVRLDDRWRRTNVHTFDPAA